MTSFESAGAAVPDVKLAELESKYGTKLDNLKLTGNGQVDRSSLLQLMSENDRKLRNWVLAGGVLVLLLALSTAALAWTTAALTNQVSTETTTSNGALVDKGNPKQALRVAPGLVTIQAASNNLNATQSLFFTNGTGIYRGDLTPENIIEGCRLVLDGSKQFSSLIPTKTDTVYRIVAVNALAANISACLNAIESSNVDGISGMVTLDGQTTMYVTCNHVTGCHSYQYISNSGNNNTNITAQTNIGRRRSLQQNAPPPPAGGAGGPDVDPQTVSDMVPEEGIQIECFPGLSSVRLADGSQKMVRDLLPGDLVQSVNPRTGSVEYSPMYLMAHRVRKGSYTFRRIRTATNHTLMLSRDHYIFLADTTAENEDNWRSRKTVPASEAHVGDKVWIFNGEEKSSDAMHLSDIVSIQEVLEEGLYAPFTLNGVIIVDGVAASVYTNMLGPERTMHLFCAWGRWLYGVMPWFFKVMDDLELASPVSQAIGRVARTALRVTMKFDSWLTESVFT